MRRFLVALPPGALIALVMGACAQLQPQFEGKVESDVDVAAVAPPPSEDKPEVPPRMQAEFDACLAGLRDDAAAAGISAATFTANTRDLVPDPGVLALLNRQPEFTTPIWDYMAGLVDEERVADGRAMLARHADTLARAQQRYGVDPATVVAVWGVESDYGRTFGTRPLLVSLATLSCFDRRQSFFRGELFSALQIIQSGDIDADRLRGSWAGAFGHTQFMPSTFQRIAVDFDGDGRRDLIGSVPDALGSTAHYLERAGWRSGQPWGYEVRVPKGFDASLAGRTDRRALSDWLRRGIERVDGRPIDLPGDTRAALLLPAGVEGPAFLVFKNFDAIYAYNASESYALAIAHLSDRLRGGGGFATPWPTDDPGLSRKERKELQALLLARGHDIGEVDGIIGSRTRDAIREEQQRLGDAVDGRAGQRLLRALRAQPQAPAAPDALAQVGRWKLQGATDAAGQPVAAVAPHGKPVHAIVFSDGSLGIEGGCNHMGGRYDIDAQGRLVVREIQSTLMACADQALMTADSAVAGLLQGASEWRIAESYPEQLYLDHADGRRSHWVAVRPAP